MRSGTPPAAPSPAEPAAARSTVETIKAVARRIGVAPPLLALAFLLPPTQGAEIAGIPSLCAFHRVTRLPCPGCGITRSVVCAAHGQWAASLHFHPLGLLVFAVLICVTVARFLPVRISLSPRTAECASVVGIVLLAAIWAGRLLGLLPSPP